MKKKQILAGNISFENGLAQSSDDNSIARILSDNTASRAVSHSGSV